MFIVYVHVHLNICIYKYIFPNGALGNLLDTESYFLYNWCVKMLWSVFQASCVEGVWVLQR